MVWVNGKILNASHPKADKWKRPEEKEKTLWGLCKSCGGTIYVGDSVGMVADHEQVVCFDCFNTLPNAHLDSAGLQFPDATLSQ